MKIDTVFMYILTILTLSSHNLICMHLSNYSDIVSFPEEEHDANSKIINDFEFISLNENKIITNTQDLSAQAFEQCIESLHQKKNFDDLMNLFLEKDLQVNHQDLSGNTLLHFLVKKSYELSKIIQLLLNRNADPNIINNEGRAPLHTLMLCKNASHDVIKLLLKNKADINIKTKKNGNTPLHIACLSSKSLDKIKLLIKKKADISIKNDHEKTPFHILCNKDSFTRNEMKELILYWIYSNKEASVKNLYAFLNTKNNEDQTLLMVACKKNNTMLVAFLFNLHMITLHALCNNIENLSWIREVFTQNLEHIIFPKDCSIIPNYMKDDEIARFIVNLWDALNTTVRNFLHFLNQRQKRYYSN